MIVKSVTAYGANLGVEPNRRILRVNGIGIRDAAHYLTIAKNLKVFKVTLGPKVRKSMFDKPTTTSSTSTTTTTTTTTTPPAKWEWNDNNIWKPFSVTNNAQIEAAYQNKMLYDYLQEVQLHQLVQLQLV